MKALTHNFANYCCNIMLHGLVLGIGWERNKLEFTAVYNSNSESFYMKKIILSREDQLLGFFFSFFLVRKMAENINIAFFFYI